MFNRHVGRAAYLIALSLIAIPLWDSITSVYPFRFGDSHWRFGSVGLLSNALMVPLQGLFFATVAATLLEHRRALRVIAVLSFLGAVLCLLAIAGFSLDALESQRDIKPELHKAFLFASFTAGSKMALGGVAMVFIGLAGWSGKAGSVTVRTPTKSSVLIGDSAPQKPAGSKVV